MPHKFLMIFLDGCGLGPADCSNPFFVAQMPCLDALIGGPLTANRYIDTPKTLCRGIDANLGTDGIPQSATGQTTLFTGINAARLIGHHLSAYPNQQLVEVIQKQSILKKLFNTGHSVTFANAYSDGYFTAPMRRRGHSVTTHLVLAAGIPFRKAPELLAGKAVYWDITNKNWAARTQSLITVPEITPQKAGENLAALAKEYSFTLYECFLTDIAGHERDMSATIEVLELLDAFIGSVVRNLDQQTTLVISSDHGNCEDLSSGGHTRNPVPLIVFGPAKDAFCEVTSIDQIAGVIERSIIRT